MSRLYRRGETWWGYWRDARGGKHRASLSTTDKAIARDRLRQREASPDSPANGAALGTALIHLLEVVYLGRAGATVSCYTQKARHVARVLGEDTPVTDITRADVLRYRAARLGEGAAEGTVYKELVVLRLALREQGFDGVVPRVSARYTPRTTHLSPQQAHALLLELQEHRRLFVMIAVYGGLRLSELERLTWDDILLADGLIHARGKKTKKSDRWLPIAVPLRPWLEAAEAAGVVLEPWGNCRRDLAAACKRAAVPRVSPNDLRRTFASWLAQDGVSSFVVAKLMGHTSTRMVEAVYAQLTAATYRAAIAHMPACTPGVHGLVPNQAKMANVVGGGAVEDEEGKAMESGEVRETSGAPTVGLEPTTRGLTVPGLRAVSPTGSRK